MKDWTNTFLVGFYTCEMTFSDSSPEDGIVCKWKPDRPKSLTEQQWAQYRAGRDELLKKIEKELGVEMIVVEV